MAGLNVFIDSGEGVIIPAVIKLIDPAKLMTISVDRERLTFDIKSEFPEDVRERVVVLDDSVTIASTADPRPPADSPAADRPPAPSKASSPLRSHMLNAPAAER